MAHIEFRCPVCVTKYKWVSGKKHKIYCYCSTCCSILAYDGKTAHKSYLNKFKLNRQLRGDIPSLIILCFHFEPSEKAAFLDRYHIDLTKYEHPMYLQSQYDHF